MVKMMVALIAVMVVAGAACSSTTVQQPTGCTGMIAEDAGANEACPLTWSCNGDTQHYSIECTAVGGNYSCLCSTDTSTLTTTIVLQPFHCDATTGLVAANSCGWTLQM